MLVEYTILRYQADELLQQIQNRKNYLIDEKKTIIAEGGDKEVLGKNQEQINQIAAVEKDACKQTKTESLIAMAIHNSQSYGFGGLGFFSRNDFSREMLKIKFQEEDRRKYINFGELPVTKAREIRQLKQSDYPEYMRYFRNVIREYQVLERINDTVKTNSLLKERWHLISEALEYFRKDDHEMFAHLIVPQIEGLFKLYIQTLHIFKETRSISEIVTQIHEQEDFFEYLYFKYDFSPFRSHIAHGDIVDVTREQAYELLMDCHWIISKIDPEERDYKKWIQWMREYDGISDDQCGIGRILDYFSDGFETADRLDNLKRFLSHSYAELLKKYDLAETGARFRRMLENDALYNAIWNADTPMIFQSDEKIVLDDKEYSITNYNNKPIKYGGLVEILHANKLCSDDWYKGYICFVSEYEEKQDELLKSVSLNG